MNFGVVHFAILRVFRRNMDFHVTQIPPFRKSMRIIKLSKHAISTISRTSQLVVSISKIFEWLYYSESMSLNGKGISSNQIIPGAGRIKVCHPMSIRASIVEGTAFKYNIAIKRNGSLVMLTTRARAIGTPFTGVDAQGPANTSIVFIGPSELK